MCSSDLLDAEAEAERVFEEPAEATLDDESDPPAAPGGALKP